MSPLSTIWPTTWLGMKMESPSTLAFRDTALFQKPRMRMESEPTAEMVHELPSSPKESERSVRTVITFLPAREAGVAVRADLRVALRGASAAVRGGVMAPSGARLSVLLGCR